MSYWGSFWWNKVKYVLEEGFTEDEKAVVYRWYRYEEEYSGRISTESLVDLTETYGPKSCKGRVTDIMLKFTKAYDRMFGGNQ